MGIDITTIFSLLTSPTGELIYHLVVGLSLILIVVLASIKVSHPTSGLRARHVLVGCGILFAFQVLLFGLALSDQPQNATLILVYGIIEHLLNALAVVWLIWTFIDTEPPFLYTGLSVFISIVILILGGVSISLSIFQPAFDNTLHLFLWQSATLFLILIGLLLILIKRPLQWGLAVIMLSLLAAGYLLHPGSNASTLQMGSIRLMKLLSFPWLITLVQRFTGKTEEKEPEKGLPEIPPKKQPKDTKPELMELLLRVNLTETPEDKYKVAARALSLSVVSDICYLVGYAEKSNKINILAGYDLIREEFLQPASLERRQMPQIIAAWDENTPLTLMQTDIKQQEKSTLTSLLNYQHLGNLLAYPLNTPDQKLFGGVIFLSPYTNKQWKQAVLQQMDNIKTTLSRVLFLQDPKSKLHTEIENLIKELEALNQQKEQLSIKLLENESQISNLQSNIKTIKANYQKEKLQTVKQIDHMKDHINLLKKQAVEQRDTSGILEQTTENLRQLVEERDQLKVELAQAKLRKKELESQTGQTGPIRLSMESQIISLDSIVANVKLQVNHQTQSKNLNLEIINPDGRQMVKTDPELLQSVLRGLLENAIHASESGGVIQLNQKITYESGMLNLQVTDYGEGLTPIEQKDLFSAEHESIPGIGSVESIRNAIQAIRVLNGKIWLRSKKGAFTTFRAQLPIRIMD